MMERFGTNIYLWDMSIFGTIYKEIFTGDVYMYILFHGHSIFTRQSKNCQQLIIPSTIKSRFISELESRNKTHTEEQSGDFKTFVAGAKAGK